MPKPSGRRLQTAIVDPRTEWTRRRLQVLLGVIVIVALAMVGGGVWSVITLLGGAPAAATRDAPQSARDQLANKPLTRAPLEAAQPGRLSSGRTGTIRMLEPRRMGPAGVATGFTQTSEGALSQLVAINTTALTSASVRVAQEVITGWAAPGGPTTETWSGVLGLAALLESAGMTSDGAAGITIGVEPAMGFIKGTVGEDFVIPCVGFIVTATASTGRPQQVAVADCQRMVWQGTRWVIGPGSEPIEAPSLWPGSQDSFDAGYQWLELP